MATTPTPTLQAESPLGLHLARQAVADLETEDLLLALEEKFTGAGYRGPMAELLAAARTWITTSGANHPVIRAALVAVADAERAEKAARLRGAA